MVYAITFVLGLSTFYNFLLLRKLYFYKRLTYHDSLTGLYNRRFFQKELSHLKRLYARHQVGFSLVLLDIDNFKQLNDSHGHLKGDQALQVIADSILSCIREEDYACRVGGEEIAILLPLTSAEDASLAAERIRSTIAQINFDCPLTVSGGVQQYRGETTHTFLKAIDDLLYLAKQSGKDRISA